ncbi:hypothetical protein DRO53_02240 [Candidatus Bathyarchaeota archaeon]|nr:MAG: hypothetical protein DRO46_03070 [Candidatus Hecatellales archaeon]RLI35021.1 MAG: hypothetical protein DRO53_02240 [Candidatus Bathyarchaeota archaeon]
MELLLALTVFIVAFILLIKSADLFVEGAVGAAYLLSLPRIIIGIVIVGLCTTLPEFAVSVQAAYMGHPEIALGNAVGSVVADDAFALALGAIIAPVILVNKRILKRFGGFLLFSAFLSYFLAFDAEVTRIEGLILASLLVVYYLYLVRTGRNLGEVEAEPPKAEIRFSLIWLVAGAVGVVLSSNLVINSAVAIAAYLGVPEVVIGLTAIALGTSLPETSTVAVSARKGYGDLAVGNILGADVLNLLWILGVSAAVNPIRVAPETIAFSYPWMLLVVSTMLAMMAWKYKLTRWKGCLLLSLYIIYIYQLAVTFFL